MFPETQAMTDHPLPENEDVEEFINEAETLPYMNEESNVSRASEEDEPDTYPDQQQLSRGRTENHTTHMVKTFLWVIKLVASRSKKLFLCLRI